MLRVSRLVDDHPEVVAVTLEPVVVAAHGLSVSAPPSAWPRRRPRRPRPEDASRVLSAVYSAPPCGSPSAARSATTSVRARFLCTERCLAVSAPP
jgi:hypothetical protein